MKSKKITILDGIGTLGAGPHGHRRHAGRRHRHDSPAKNVVLAAGSVPRTIPGFEPGRARS